MQRTWEKQLAREPDGMEELRRRDWGRRDWGRRDWGRRRARVPVPVPGARGGRREWAAVWAGGALQWELMEPMETVKWMRRGRSQARRSR